MFAATLSLTGLGTYEIYQVISPADITWLQVIFAALFAVTFAWISFACASAVLGFLCLRRQRYLLADHIRTEAGHGWGYIQQANLLDPGRDHAQPDPEFERRHGLKPSMDFIELMKRDFLSYLIGGNLWPYGHCTAATIQSILITTPRVLDFEERVVHAEERGHHDAILQKLHDFVWELIEQFGEAAIRKRIAEIDAKALNSGSRVIFDPPRREFLRKHFSAPIENVVKFPAWREYLYLNVLGFPPEPVVIETWPEEIPQPRAA